MPCLSSSWRPPHSLCPFATSPHITASCAFSDPAASYEDLALTLVAQVTSTASPPQDRYAHLHHLSCVRSHAHRLGDRGVDIFGDVIQQPLEVREPADVSKQPSSRLIPKHQDGCQRIDICLKPCTCSWLYSDIEENSNLISVLTITTENLDILKNLEISWIICLVSIKTGK